MSSPSPSHARPVGTVQVMGSYQGKVALGCLLDHRATGVKVGDKLYARPQTAAADLPPDLGHAFARLSAALGHPNPVEALQGQSIEAALVDLAVARLIQIGART